MYVLVTDETNVQPTDDDAFFIYGGLVFSPEQMKRITADIEAIRGRYGFKADDKLKFDTNSRPTGMSRDTYTEAKNEVVQSCIKADVKFISYMILHAIAKDPQWRGEYALNSVLVAFNRKFLPEHDAYGVVAIDRLPAEGAAFGMLKRKFQVGLELSASEATVKLDRVLLYSITCDGASHLSSAVDIVLGCLRWVVNQRNSGVESPIAATLLDNVAKLMYHKKAGDDLLVRERGLIVRPNEVKHPPYREKYDELLKYFAALLNG